MTDPFNRAAKQIISQLGEPATYHYDQTGVDVSLRVIVTRDVQDTPDDFVVRHTESRHWIDMLKADLSTEPRKCDTVTLTGSGEVFTVQAKPIRDDGFVYRLTVR